MRRFPFPTQPAVSPSRLGQLLIAVVLTSFLAVPLCRADPTSAAAAALDRKVIEEVKSHSEIMANLTYLCDVIGPRLTGSVQLKRANDWTAERMRSYGLSHVHLEGYTIPAGWERGPATARIVEPDNGRTIILASQAWTPGTNGKIVGDVVYLKASNREELAAYKGKLKGAIILRSPPATIRPITDPNFASPPRPVKPSPAKAESGKPPAVAAPPAKPVKPIVPSRGPLGNRINFFLEMNEFLRTEGVAALLTDAGKPQGLLMMYGGWQTSTRPNTPPPLPTLFVAHEHYALLYRLATRPAPARTRLELEVKNTFVPGPLTVSNTIGEIRGSTKPDEFVVVGAHLDSWDLGQGATDNGTGSAVVLETARVLAQSGIKPARTIRFALFSGEEQGLHGSGAYVKEHQAEMARTSVCLVHDSGTGQVVGLGLQGREALKPLLESQLASLQALGFKDFNQRGDLGGSDHASFERAGVPGFLFQQDMAEYRFSYHSQTDTLDKAQEANLIQAAQVMAVTALRIANLPQLLPRDRSAKPAPGKPGGEKPVTRIDKK